MMTQLPCGCQPHKTRHDKSGYLYYCDTEGSQGYCNFECPHEGPACAACGEADSLCRIAGGYCCEACRTADTHREGGAS